MSSRQDTIEFGKHAALAQFHRWFQIYESKDVTIESAIEMMSPEILIRSRLGESRGHSSYRQRVESLPPQWQNAHFVVDSSIAAPADELLILNANVEYLNIGMKGDLIRKASLRYQVQFRRTAGILPILTSVEIEQIDEGVSSHFVEAYTINRCMSLYHCMMAIFFSSKNLEDNALCKEIFATEIIDSSCSVSDKPHHITQFLTRFSQDTPMKALGSRKTGNGTFELDLQCGSARLTMDIADNPLNRFGRILSIQETHH